MAWKMLNHKSRCRFVRRGSHLSVHRRSSISPFRTLPSTPTYRGRTKWFRNRANVYVSLVFFFFSFFFFFPVDLASLPSRRRDTRPFQKARQVTRRRGCYSYLRVDAGVESNGNGVTSLPSKYEKIGWKNNQRAEYSISRFTRYTCKL